MWIACALLIQPTKHIKSIISYTLNWTFINPSTAKLLNLNFYTFEVVSRWRDPQLQVSENYSKWRSTLFKSCWLMSHFIFNIFKMWYLMHVLIKNEKPNICDTGGQRVNQFSLNPRPGPGPGKRYNLSRRCLGPGTTFGALYYMYYVTKTTRPSFKPGTPSLRVRNRTD